MKVKLFSTTSFVFAVILVISCSTIHTLSAEEEHTHTLFQDDFKDWKSDAWDMYIPPDAAYGTSWDILEDEGNKLLSLTGTMVASVGDLDWANYTLMVKVKFVNLPDESYIFFRMIDEGRYIVGIHQQSLELEKEHKGKHDFLAKVENAYDEDTWYVFKIVCLADSFQVYIDEELKIEHTDEHAPLLSGGIGFGCGPQSTAYFDDIRVTVSHIDYIMNLIEVAENAIEEARMVEADIEEAESMIEEAEAKLAEGELNFAEYMARDAAAKAIVSKAEKSSTTQEPPPQDQQTSTTQLGSTLSVERIATLITIGGAAIGAVGWIFRTRGIRRRRVILYRELVQMVNDTYNRLKTDAIHCETELYRLKEHVINEFKQGLITEENYSALDERIEDYIKRIRDETEKQKLEGA